MARDDQTTFTVGELNRLIRHALSVTFPDEVWVEGEISSLKRHEASGHVYFQLVEAVDGARQADATVQVALYRANRAAVNAQLKRANRRMTEAPGVAASDGASVVADGPALPNAAVRMADGIHIRIRGALDYHPPSGKLQLRMTAIDPAHTLGRLATERDRVLAALATEGLLDRNERLDFPLLPLRLGLVTSEGSAAQADFLHELTTSRLGWRITLVPARVQGPGADVSVAAALRLLDTHPVDVIAIVRGGGARTDLLAFDSEIVARAIAAARVPVVTGIGHEIDSSVADAVAARAFKTPTACAAALVEHARHAIERTEVTWAAIAARADTALARHEHALLTTGRHVTFAARTRLDLCAQQVEHTQDRVARRVPAVLLAAEQRLAVQHARVDAVDPRRALARGWSITRTADGRVVRDASTVAPGDDLVTLVAAGSIQSRVVATDTTDPADADRDDGR